MTTESSALSKAQVIKSLQALPDDAMIGDMIEHLYFLYKVQQGLEAAEQGDLLSQDEVEEQVRLWLRSAGRGPD